MNKTMINCYLIEPAEDLILLLSRPKEILTEYVRDNYNVYSKWLLYFIELYNNKYEFLLMANLEINNTKASKLEIIDKSYKDNYENMKKILIKLKKEK